MEPTLCVKLGGESLTIKRLSVQEMLKVKSWTAGQISSRQELWEAIKAEDPEALIAAYCLAKARAGDTVRFADADFDLDSLDVTVVADNGREVEPVVQRNDQDEPRLDDNGNAIPVLNADGSAKWRYVDTGEEVPPTETASSTT